MTTWNIEENISPSSSWNIEGYMLSNVLTDSAGDILCNSGGEQLTTSGEGILAPDVATQWNISS